MSKIEVDAIDKQSGSTLTLGGSGTAVTLACGATQTGFGRTGTVDWQTTPKTGDFTAANGEGYFVNTTSGAIIMTMPSGSAGAIVSIQDYNKTFDSNSFTVTPASGEKINGGTASAPLAISTEGQGLTFVYVDGTVGWKTVHENEFTAGGSTFITATGGTITTSPCGNDKIHTFTGPGTFCVTAGGSPTNGVVSYMVIAGGGGGACARSNNNCGSGGGGAGGFREFKSPVTPYTASPLDGNPGGTSISITAPAAFPITVGAGGIGAAGPGPNNLAPTRPTNGSDSIFSTVTSTGGGRAGGGDNAGAPSPADYEGQPGGSGGGSGRDCKAAGNGNTPPVSPAQGFNGGQGISSPAGPGTRGGGGGGGATAVGQDGQFDGGGDGGAGATTSINGTPTARTGGGGGGGVSGDTGPGTGGTGGGGNGGYFVPADPAGTGNATAGTTNTGGGGGGMGSSGPPGQGSQVSGNGGSGIVIIRYKFQ